MNPPDRSIRQLLSVDGSQQLPMGRLIALCHDGSIWMLPMIVVDHQHNQPWIRLKDIPTPREPGFEKKNS